MARQENGITPVIEALEAGPDGGWRKAVLSLPAKGTPWTKVTAEPVALADGAAIKVVASEGGRQRTWTVALERWPGYLKGLLVAHPTHINVVGNTRDWHAREAKSGRWLVSRGKPSLAAASDAPAPHDRPSYHPLPDDDSAVRQLFIETGLYSLNGKLRGEAADKYRQVQHYLELLRPLEVLTPPGGPTPKPLRIVDAGCGKAYLSLALQLFARRLGFRPELVGVDRDAEVIAAVEGIAQRLELEDVRFEARSIVQYAEPAGDIDLLVSLHACDTATDEALAAGIRLSARAIVLVPCCHHELVEQIEERLKAGETLAGGSWDAVTGAGLLRHRLADIITDALRAAALEAHGYKTSVIEFISPEATARNLMLRAEKRADSAATEKAKARGLDEYRRLRDACGVSPSLERLLDGWPGE